MGLMRRVESRVEKAAGAGPERTSPQRSGRAGSEKGSKPGVQPAELARKLVREMEDHKVSRSTRVSVCNHYTVYLCPADHQRLGNREPEVLSALERHLHKHVQAKKYEVPGDLAVAMVMDPDLAPGYFGILAERVGAAQVKGVGPVATSTAPVSPARVAAPDQAVAAASVLSAPARVRPARGLTKVIGSGEAAKLGLVRRTLVLKTGDRVREYSQGRVVVGRARDADFKVDDPNVSRRHAAIYWADGGIVVEDLGSTNGTLVNGSPVTNTVLRSGDVVAIGDCRITVETR